VEQGLALCSTSVACFADLDRLPCGAHDIGNAPPGALDSIRATCDPAIYDSGHATRGSGISGLPAKLLALPSGYAGATDTSSTSAVATDKGRIGGSSDQPSSDDHAGEEGLPAFDRQTHPFTQFGVDLVAGALLHLRRPRQS
jgi:hypothetical protein